MKFVRFGKTSQSAPAPGLIDREGKIRDLSHSIKEIQCEFLAAHLNSFSDLSQFPVAGELSHHHLFPCVPRPSKLIGVAFNSKIHTKEMGKEMASEPIFFLKAPSAVSGAKDPIVYPKVGKKLDWEAELGVVIGKKGKYIPHAKALDHVLGYCCINDVSDRWWQFEHPGQEMTKGKSFDTFAPMGPYLVTKDEIPNPNHLKVLLKVNGETRQDFSTADYQHSVETCISFLSQLFTLEPGDVISMGSGPGNAGFWKNQFLQVGDRVELEIEHLGKQEQTVVKEQAVHI